jgi:hypothetical protein
LLSQVSHCHRLKQVNFLKLSENWVGVFLCFGTAFYML